MSRAGFAVAVVALWGCSTELPVKYEICNATGGECFLDARFKEFKTCENYKQQQDMLCQRKAGAINCVENPGPSTASSRCTK